MENVCGEGVRTRYWLRGTIEDDRLVLWVFQLEGKLYWANVVEDVSGRLSIVATEDKLRASVFTMYSTETSLQLSIYHNGIQYYVKGSEAGTGISVAELSTNAEWLSMSTTDIQPFQDIATGVNYLASFFSQSLGVRIEDGGGCGNNSEYVFSFRVIPTIVYPLGNCGEPIDSVSEIVNLEQNWALTDKYVLDFFTSSEECYNGIFYNYCRIGQGCSMTCKGVCELNSVCEYNVSKLGWECVDPSPARESGSIFGRASFWFIVALIVVILSSIAIAIGIYQYTSRRVKNIDAPTDVGQEVFVNPDQLLTENNLSTIQGF